jgi:hypothetical protein
MIQILKYFILKATHVFSSELYMNWKQELDFLNFTF